MAISHINLANIKVGSINNIQHSPREQETSKVGFGDFLKTAINEVNNAQLQSDAATASLVRGDDIELHDVMISAQKASITLQAALEIRNKAVEAYQEMMRMQV